MQQLSDEDRIACLEQLAQRLRREVPDAVADELPEDAMYYAFITKDDHYWRELEQATERLLRTYSAGAASSAAPPSREERGAPQEIEFELDDYTLRRGEVLAELAELRLDVRRFRQRYLRGRLMTEEEADAFLAGHETGRSALGLRTTAPRKLWRLARRLANSYGWREHAAARFVLTGRPPELLSVAVGFLDDGILDYVPNTASIFIRADVRVSVEEVAGAFKAA